jgi:transcriptional regulator with PAS, ATPase and Fis domain
MEPSMLVGRSAVMQELRVRVARVARTNFTVLVEGESGAGKELVARELHQGSSRAHGPFVAVNCAALVETLVEAELFGIEERTATGVRGRRGKFEQADQGTLFLDEVADLAPMAQAKLLRVLQDMSVERVGGHYSRQLDVRIVAATNRRLGELVDAGRFRPDLYYRLSGVELQVPPLRARRSDIPLLIDHFISRHRRTRAVAVSVRAVEAMVAFDWPGNVRQLGRVLEHAVALSPGPAIELADLPTDISKEYHDMQGAEGPDESLRAWCSRYVRLVLDRCNGNKRRACQILDISYHTLQGHLEYDAIQAHACRCGPKLSAVSEAIVPPTAAS